MCSSQNESTSKAMYVWLKPLVYMNHKKNLFRQQFPGKGGIFCQLSSFFFWKFESLNGKVFLLLSSFLWIYIKIACKHIWIMNT